MKKKSKSKKQQVSVAPKQNAFGLRPLGDRVVVKETKAEEGKKTSSGIYIPDSVKDDKGSKRGIVVAVGPGRIEDGKLFPVNVKVGETVLFSWGDTLPFEGEEYIVVRESEIAAVIK